MQGKKKRLLFCIVLGLHYLCGAFFSLSECDGELGKQKLIFSNTNFLKMKTYNLEATPREIVGRKASKILRKEGLIPAVLYGRTPVDLPYQGTLSAGEKIVEIGNQKGVVVTDFTVSFDGVRKLIYTPEIYVVDIDIKGSKHVKAILKDSQYHPVTDNILHIDFLEVFDDKPIVMEVPVLLEGHAQGVKAGGKLNQTIRKLKVRGLSGNIPELLKVNVEHLELGKVIKVGELSFDNIEVVNPKSTVVCIVKMTRASQSAAASAGK
jgi:large subunit ribosomal protein L25